MNQTPTLGSESQGKGEGSTHRDLRLRCRAGLHQSLQQYTVIVRSGSGRSTSGTHPGYPRMSFVSVPGTTRGPRAEIVSAPYHTRFSLRHQCSLGCTRRSLGRLKTKVTGRGIRKKQEWQRSLRQTKWDLEQITGPIKSTSGPQPLNLFTPPPHLVPDSGLATHPEP